MKTLLTLVVALSLSQAYAQISRIPAPATGMPAAGTSSTSGMMNTNTTTDTVGTSQSSTTKKELSKRPGTMTPAKGANCVDRSGKKFRSGDAGHTACVNSMKAK